MFSANPYIEPMEGTKQWERERFEPMVMLHETPTTYEIELDVPDARANDIDVRVHRHDVVIRCRHAIDRLSDGHVFGSFLKRIHLDHAIDTGHVHTMLAGGKLDITAAKC